MNCEKLHVTDEAFRKLVRDNEELRRENNALRQEIDRLVEVGVEERRMSRESALEEAAQALLERDDYDPEYGGATLDVVEAAQVVRALKERS